MLVMLRNSPAIPRTYKSITVEKLLFGEAIQKFQSGPVDFAASEEEIRVRTERNAEEKNMKLHMSQNVSVQAVVISSVSVRLISLIFVLLGIVLLLIANGGPP
jgi:hypothetical protein